MDPMISVGTFARMRAVADAQRQVTRDAFVAASGDTASALLDLLGSLVLLDDAAIDFRAARRAACTPRPGRADARPNVGNGVAKVLVAEYGAAQARALVAEAVRQLGAIDRAIAGFGGS